MPRRLEMNEGECFGSILLHDALWQSLTAVNGQSVPWVHGCILERGHDGDHGAPAYHTQGEPQHWLRWADAGPAHLERVEPTRPGRHTKAHAAPPNTPLPEVPPAKSAKPEPPGESGFPRSDVQAEALWAIAAALDRIAEVIATYAANASRDETHGPSPGP